MKYLIEYRIIYKSILSAWDTGWTTFHAPSPWSTQVADADIWTTYAVQQPFHAQHAIDHSSSTIGIVWWKDDRAAQAYIQHYLIAWYLPTQFKNRTLLQFRVEAYP